MKVKSQKAPLVRLMKLVRGQPLRRWELRVNEALLSRDPCTRFLATVMAEAMLDLYQRGSRRYAEDALAWLNARGNGWLCDFENLCDVLDVDPQRMRADVRDDVRSGKTKLGSRITC